MTALGCLSPLVVNAETSAPTDFHNWKQIGDPWGPLAYYGNNVGQYVGLKSGQSFQNYGCYVVSAAIQVARSGADERPDFSPVLFAKDLWLNGGMTPEGYFINAGPRNIYGDAFTMVTPINNNGEVEYVPGTSYVQITDSTPAAIYDAVLKHSYDEGLYMVIRGRNQSGSIPSHFMAIEKAENGEVYINDPNSNAKTLTEVNAAYMYSGGYYQFVLYRSNVKDFNETLKGTQPEGVRPTEDEIAVAVKRWDEKTIPGLPTEYDPTWETATLPPGYIPDDEQAQGITIWVSDVDQYRLEQKSQMLRLTFIGTGFIIIGYAVLLLLCGILSDVLSIDLVVYITFQRYKYNPLTDRHSGTLQLPQVIVMALLTTVLGVFILNGGLFKLILALFYWSVKCMEYFSV